MSVLVLGQQTNVAERSLFVRKILGNGGFGTVYMVSDVNQREYALKVIVCENPSSIDSAKHGVNTLTKVNHERIVQIVAADSGFTIPKYDIVFFILTEYCRGGDLNSRLNQPSTREKNLKWICQLSEALSYLHSLWPPIVHRDLKTDNVLLTDQFTEDLKLGDFGLAREYLAMKNNDGSPHSAQMYYMKSGVGTMHWMAPEIFREHYTEKADVFSLGGIFYAILTRDFVQTTSRKVYGVFLTYQLRGKVGLGYAMHYINQKAVVLFPSCFQGSDAMKRLIENMLSYDHHNRPTACEVNDSVKNICSSV